MCITSRSKLKSMFSSAETIGNNQDILTQILLRLPAKPLLKFKCVSKQWLSLISHPDFCLSHACHQRRLNRIPNALLVSRCYSCNPVIPGVDVVPLNDTTKLPFFDYMNEAWIKIEESCNGLLLCSSPVLEPRRRNWRPFETDEVVHDSEVNDDDHCGRYRFFICNPITKSFKFLTFPRRISKCFEPWGAFLSLAFDPVQSPYYKVICLYELDKKTREFGINTYSSETKSWTQKPVLFHRSFRMRLHPRVFCNSAIHWLDRYKTSPYFDVYNETLKTMPMPSVIISDWSWVILYFGESRGHLQMAVTKRCLDMSLKFDVLEMASDYSSWSVRYHVDLQDLHSIKTLLPKLSSLHTRVAGAFSVLSIIRAEKEEESTVILFLDGGITISYNPFDGILNKLCQLRRRGFADFGKLEYDGYCAYQYLETLVCA